MFTTCESTTIDYCREREAFGHPMLCLRLLSLHNALRRTALRLGCEILSGVSCEEVYPVLGKGGEKRAALVMTEEGGEEEVVTVDFVVGADGLKSVVRARLGGEKTRTVVLGAVIVLTESAPTGQFATWKYNTSPTSVIQISRVWYIVFGGT